MGRLFAWYEAIFGSVLLSIVMIRIGRPIFNLDWIPSSLLYFMLGLLLSANSRCLLSADSLGAVTALDWCHTRRGVWYSLVGREWLTRLFCIAFLIVSRLAVLPTNLDVVPAVDLCLKGVSLPVSTFSAGKAGTIGTNESVKSAIECRSRPARNA